MDCWSDCMWSLTSVEGRSRGRRGVGFQTPAVGLVPTLLSQYRYYVTKYGHIPDGAFAFKSIGSELRFETGEKEVPTDRR